MVSAILHIIAHSDEDLDVWITYLEGLRMKLKDLGSTKTDKYVIVIF